MYWWLGIFTVILSAVLLVLFVEPLLKLLTDKVTNDRDESIKAYMIIWGIVIILGVLIWPLLLGIVIAVLVKNQDKVKRTVEIWKE